MSNDTHLTPEKSTELADLRREVERLRLVEARHQQALQAKQDNGAPQPVVRCEALLDAFPDLMFVVRGDGVVLDVRGGQNAMLHRNLSEIPGKNIRDILPPEIAEQRLQSIQRALQTGSTQTIEYPIFVNGQTRYEESRIVPNGTNQVLNIVRDVTHGKIAEDLSQHRLAADNLMTEISTDIVNLEFTQIDAGIEVELGKLGNFAAADRAYIFRIDDNGNVMNNTHEWCAPNVEPHIDNLQNVPANTFPYLMAQLRLLKPFRIDDVTALPPEAAAEKAEFEQEGIQSVLCVPLISQNRLTGFLGFDVVQDKRTWRNADVQMLQLVGEIFVAAFQRKEAEAALQQERAVLRGLVDSIPDLIFYKDPHGVYLGCNPAFAKFAGQAESDLVGKTDFDLFPQDVAEFFQEQDQLMMQEGRARQNQEWVDYPDGRRRLLDTLKTPFYRSDGELLGMLGISRDITERKQAEDALLESESRYRQILDSMTQMVLVKGEESRIIWANKAFRDYYGMSNEDLQNLIDASFNEPDYTQQYVKDDAYVFETGNVLDIPEEPVTRHDGHVGIFHTIKSPIFDAEGNIIMTVGVSEEITERKRVQEAVEKQAAELQTVAEVSTTVATTLDTDTLLQDVVDLTKERFSLYHAHIYLLNEAGDTLELAAGAGEAGRTMVAEGWSIPYNREHSLVAQAAQRREGVIVNDVQQAPDFMANPLLPDTRAEMAVPLLVGSQLLGVLDVQANAIDRFTEQDVQIKTTLASQVAVALQNARQYQQAQQALDDARIFRELVANSGQGIGLADMDGVVTYLNPAMGEMLGIEDVETEYGQALTRYYPSENQQMIFDTLIPQVLETGNWTGELEFLSSDGHKIPTIQSVFLVRDEAGVPRYLANTITDVSAIKEAEAELLRLGYVVEQSLDGTAIANTEGYIQFVNPAWAKMHGYSVDELIGKHLSIFHTETQLKEEIGPMNQAVLETGQPQQIEVGHVRRDGSNFPTLMTVGLLRDEADQPIGFAAWTQDITKRKQAEADQQQLTQTLAQERGTLEAILEGLPLGVFVVESPTGRPLITNSGAAELLGQGINPDVAKDELAEVYQVYRYGTDELYPPDQMPLVRGMAGESATVEDMEIRKPNGERHLLRVFGAPIKNSEGDITSSVAIFQDITTEREAAEAIAKQAEELQTVADLSTTVSTTLDPDKLLQEVVDLTKSRFSLYHAHIYLLNEAGDTLKLAAGADEAGRTMVSQGWSIPYEREHSLVAQAARRHEGVIVNDVQATPDFMPNPLLPDTRSEMAIPMVVGGKLIGVFDVQADIVDRFTEQDVQLKTTLAAQVAVALENARHLSRTMRQADKERLINDISRKIQGTVTIENALQTAVKELGEALNARHTQVRLKSLATNGQSTDKTSTPGNGSR